MGIVGRIPDRVSSRRYLLTTFLLTSPVSTLDTTLLSDPAPFFLHVIGTPTTTLSVRHCLLTQNCRRMLSTSDYPLLRTSPL